MKKLSNHTAGLLALASGILFFVPLGWRTLWDSDEGRYAEIGREMLELKDWVTPHLNYIRYFEKPPLVYWLTAIAMRVGGLNAFSARFNCALFGVLTVLMTYWFGKHWRSQRVGVLAGAVLATSLGFFAMTQYLVLDLVLTFWNIFTLYAVSRMLTERLPEKVARFAYLAVIAISGGILTKGPVALVLPVIVIAGVMIHHHLQSLWDKIPWKGCFILGVMLVAPWFILVSIRNPIFPYFFIVHEHLQRYLTSIHHRTEPIYFFIPVVLVGFLPWTIFLPRVIYSWFSNHGMALKKDITGELLLGWVVFVFVFFSLSHSKLVGYMLPIFPALALLVAAEFEQSWGLQEIPAWIIRGIIALIVVAVIALILLKWPDPLSTDPAYLAVAAQAGLLAFALGIAVFVGVGVWGMRQASACFVGICGIQVVLLWTMVALAGQLDPFLSTQAVAQSLSSQLQPSDRVIVYGISYENYTQTLPFFLQRRVAVYGPLGELADLPIEESGPDFAAWLTSEDNDSNALLREPAGSWVVTDQEHLDALQRLAPADMFQPQGHQQRFVLVRKIT